VNIEMRIIEKKGVEKMIIRREEERR